MRTSRPILILTGLHMLESVITNLGLTCNPYTTQIGRDVRIIVAHSTVEQAVDVLKLDGRLESDDHVGHFLAVVGEALLSMGSSRGPCYATSL